MTEYDYEYYSVSQKLSNTNTNIIRFPKNDRIQIRISLSFPKITIYKYEYYSVFQMTEYKYKYYSATQKWSNMNMNTNVIRFPNNDWIQISFGLPKIIKYYIQIQILLSFPKGRPPSSQSHKVVQDFIN